MKFSIVSTSGTAKVLRAHGVRVEEVGRYDQGEGDQLNLIALVKQNSIALIINTPSSKSSSQYDMRSFRATAILHNIPCITTLQGAREAVNGIEAMRHKDFGVQSLQDHYKIGRGVSCVA